MVIFLHGWSYPISEKDKCQQQNLLILLTFYLISGSVSRDRARTNAMNFLHEMGYNYVKAKFYIMFPYYLTYNKFKCHQPLNLSDNEMARRIA